MRDLRSLYKCLHFQWSQEVRESSLHVKARFPFQINFAFGLRMGVGARGVGSFTAGPLALTHNLGTFLSTNAEKYWATRKKTFQTILISIKEAG